GTGAMKDGMRVGERFTHDFVVPPHKTVRHLYPESPEFAEAPEVFATGFMVGLMEWACVRAMAPYLEPGEGSLGTAICVTHTAATPPGLTVTVTAELRSVEGRRLSWRVSAHDGVDEIGSGTHERAVIHLEKFNAKVRQKTPAG
uniref:Fluoroacetyl coenzyme A thioesterase n=1 Tax=Streptantibioticus cattleyicolor TaxID=29303 RepID=UPI0001E6906D|nr:Chain A, Fluoroacetyl coenzyme A thioesterase [Streptantibioticus cattleyicolor]3P3F_B Chain B, Fluoroacetyl coenzyme A thioesterase [Streptantibioticus cattleyicolor]3P3F_C Chain C, Fluoroacetyl coenzyme A thioesterase [Streptantibioticus cattleyicolor]3P3F_D Chain D, Fluoroacetyl coenzyme A thioesterase [Streptantibioticus cattleyicolor]3P3F_E Chain E, Fluoroacetyl coenzyme A thioesterase [Streptantibioticus cattleyicolor]3P3F_F Chain F, Fluoroacetyl coenzyme A thioesterase [Streptantibio